MTARDTFRLTAIAAGLLAAFGPAGAAESGDAAALAKPASTASIGLGYADNDSLRFGQYTGVVEDGAYGLLDFNLVKRDDASGTWLRFIGRNVGLENRQLRLEQSRQGNWGYYIEYGQIPRYEPYTVTTGVGGIGSPNLTIPGTPTAGVPVELKTKREAIGLGFEKFLYGNWDLQVRFRNEDKDGARVFARGTTGAGPVGSFGAFEFAPEPINSTTRQLDAKINYSGAQLQLSGGYYGTTYNNQYSQINFTGGLAALSTFTPIALPPDNQSHQAYLAGGYSFTATTRGNFKVAYAKATQDDAFPTGVNVPLAPGIGNNLMGRVDTTLAQAGVTSSPMPKLTLRADFRYEDRDDKTPVLRYNTLATGTSTFNGDNEPRSIQTTKGKVEASYALPMAFRVTGGVDYEEKKRNVSPVRVVSARETTDETSLRAELRRSMSETITGALLYVHSDRGGSPFLLTTLNNGTPGSNLVAPLHLADRSRDKVRLTLNWMPAEPLSVQFYVETARDEYDGEALRTLGPMSGEAQNYSVDVTYAFSDRWQGTAWYSYNDNKAEQRTQVGAPTGQLWMATLRNVADNIGLGVRGKPGRLEIGADVSYSDINDEYQQQALTGAPIASLPDVTTKLTRVNVFAKYPLQKNSGVRLDYIYDRFETNDWTWTTWTYADGTRLTQSPLQQVNFVGISYYHRWQ
jgi:MtrB/PioB family decaheme-associated outer membrane protein